MFLLGYIQFYSIKPTFRLIGKLWDIKALENEEYVLVDLVVFVRYVSIINIEFPHEVNIRVH